MGTIDRQAAGLTGLAPGPPELARGTATATAAARAATPFVGRERELADLRAALGAAEAGTSRLVLLLGEPGVGKTRLSTEVLADARARDWATVIARCPEGDAGTPAYWPWVQVLRGLVQQVRDVGDLRLRLGAQVTDLAPFVAVLDDPGRSSARPVLEAASARFRFFDSVCALLRAVAAELPTLVVIEDLHGADEDSLRLLRFVVGELGSARVVVIGTYRDVEVQRDHPLSAIVAELVREPTATSIPLGGFTEDEVATFFERMTAALPSAELTRQLYRRTEGNPFFVTEVVRLLIADGYGKGGGDPAIGVEIPNGVREVVRTRLRRLSAGAYTALETAALLGREFDLVLLEQLSGASQLELLAHLDEALRSRIVQRVHDAPSRLRFSHALVRETLYDDIGSRRRVEMHRRVGELLEATASLAEGALGDLAHHFEQSAIGGDVRKAVTYALRAARHARSQFAYAEAANYLGRAVSWLQRDVAHDPLELCDLTLELADAHLIAGNPSMARDIFRRAGAIAERLGLPERLALAAIGVSGPVVRFGTVDHGTIGLLESALRSLPPQARALRARVLGRLSIELQYTAPVERRAAMTDEAMQIARELGDVRTLSDLMVERRSRRWKSEPIEVRLADSANLERLADKTGNVELGLDARGWRILDLLEVGDFESAKHEMDVYATMAEPLRLPIYSHRAVGYQTIRATLEGRLEDAEGLSFEFFAIARRVSDWHANAAFACQLFVIRRLRGMSFDELLAPTERLLASSPALGPARAGLAIAYFEQGRLADARRHYERFAEHDFALVSEDIFWAGTVAFLSELCAAFEDQPRAARLYEMMSPYAERSAVFGLAGSLGSASRTLGVLATTMGEWALAEQHLRDAIAANDRMGAVPFAALSRQAYATMLLRRALPADRAPAAALLEEALATARRTGMGRLEREASETLAGLAAEAAPGAVVITEGSLPTVAAEPPSSRAPADSRNPGASASASDGILWRREGDFWSIGPVATPLRLRDSVGVRCLAELLRRPNEEVLALELARLATGAPLNAPTVLAGKLGGAADARARDEYRARVGELRDALERAEQLQDEVTADRIRGEMQAIAAVLSRSFGLHGRERASGGPLERARINVTRTIRDAMRRVEQHDAALGRHLRASIRTGTYCGYFPRVGRAQNWLV